VGKRGALVSILLCPVNSIKCNYGRPALVVFTGDRGKFWSLLDCWLKCVIQELPRRSLNGCSLSKSGRMRENRASTVLSICRVILGGARYRSGEKRIVTLSMSVLTKDVDKGLGIQIENAIRAETKIHVLYHRDHP